MYKIYHIHCRTCRLVELLSDKMKYRDIYPVLNTPISKSKLPLFIMVWAPTKTLKLKYSSLSLFAHNIFIKIKTEIYHVVEPKSLLRT